MKFTLIIYNNGNSYVKLSHQRPIEMRKKIYDFEKVVSERASDLIKTKGKIATELGISF